MCTLKCTIATEFDSLFLRSSIQCVFFFNFRNNLCNVNIKKKLNSIGHKESQVRFMAVISELVVWDVVSNARCRAYFAVHYRCKRLTLHTTPLNTFFSQWLFLNYRAEKRTAEQMSGEENWRIKKNGWFSKMTATRYDATKNPFFLFRFRFVRLPQNRSMNFTTHIYTRKNRKEANWR